jgi:hypothetical protein
MTKNANKAQESNDHKHQEPKKTTTVNTNKTHESNDHKHQQSLKEHYQQQQ